MEKENLDKEEESKEEVNSVSDQHTENERRLEPEIQIKPLESKYDKERAHEVDPEKSLIDALPPSGVDLSTNALAFIKTSEDYKKLIDRNTESLCESDVNTEAIENDVELEIINVSDEGNK